MLVTILQQIGAALIGAGAGTAVTGAADHFTVDRSVWPFPICRHCGRREALPAWLPLVGSWWASRPCRSCSGGGAWVVPLAGQLVCMALTLALLHQYGVGLPLVCAAIETYTLLAIALTDFQHRLIPTMLVYPALILALATSPIWPNLGLWNSVLGAAAAFGFFFLMSLLARFLFGEGALGDGDVSLAALIGAISGFPLVVLSLAIGAFAGGLGAILALVLRRSTFGAAIPYGPFLVIGVLYTLVSGNTLHPMYVVL